LRVRITSRTFDMSRRLSAGNASRYSSTVPASEYMFALLRKGCFWLFCLGLRQAVLFHQSPLSTYSLLPFRSYHTLRHSSSDSSTQAYPSRLVKRPGWVL
jgi:hypothetical protein